MAADILKIQKSVRKSVKDYAIAGNHEEEALIVLLSTNIYLALEEKDTPSPSKTRPKSSVLQVLPVQE